MYMKKYNLTFFICGCFFILFCLSSCSNKLYYFNDQVLNFEVYKTDEMEKLLFVCNGTVKNENLFELLENTKIDVFCDSYKVNIDINDCLVTRIPKSKDSIEFAISYYIILKNKIKNAANVKVLASCLSAKINKDIEIKDDEHDILFFPDVYEIVEGVNIDVYTLRLRNREATTRSSNMIDLVITAEDNGIIWQTPPGKTLFQLISPVRTEKIGESYKTSLFWNKKYMEMYYPNQKKDSDDDDDDNPKAKIVSSSYNLPELTEGIYYAWLFIPSSIPYDYKFPFYLKF